MKRPTRWLSASEVAAMELPGLPRSAKGVLERAKREGWESRPRQGRGGGREFPDRVFPDRARLALDVLAALRAPSSGRRWSVVKRVRVVWRVVKLAWRLTGGRS